MTVYHVDNDLTYEYFELDTDPSVFTGAEQFVELWNIKRGSNQLPKWSDYDWDDYTPWSGFIAISDITWDPYDFKYRLYGTNLVTKFGRDLTGRKGSDLYGHEYTENLSYEFYKMVAQGPYISRVHGSSPIIGREFIRREYVEVPLSETGDRVTHTIALVTIF